MAPIISIPACDGGKEKRHGMKLMLIALLKGRAEGRLPELIALVPRAE